jgi:hypothetical protein
LSKYKYIIKEIYKNEALSMIQKHHYSNILPKLNKYFLGFYLNDELVGVVTLGWGTRPLHTIKKIFPSLETKDYLEIGRMCMTDDMPKNSESQMLSQLIKWIKINLPNIKVLFTWADGMLGKVGYVYQASNFLYAGFSITDFYMKDGIKLHPRQMKSMLIPEGQKDNRITVRPTIEQCNTLNISHYRGKQFKYIYFICDNKTRKQLKSECLYDLSINYPKENDLSWKKKNYNGKWIECEKPPYISDINKDVDFKLSFNT